ncbi:MAG: acetyl-CoA carboxylase biotin carboxyl carrier protein subunit [Candidatus Eisenbacteria bacterium]
MRVDGKALEEPAPLPPHRWSAGGRLVLTIEGREVEAIVLRAGAGRYEVWIDSERHVVEADRAGGGSRGGGGEEDALVAPMPAKVLRLEVAAGSAVELGQTLLVLESMKMELGITSPRAGRVERVGAGVVVGAIVPAGTVLIELVPEPDAR